MPTGAELDEKLGVLELEGVKPVPSGTELEDVGTYAMMELDEGGGMWTELDDAGATYCELEDEGATTMLELDPVPKGTGTDAGVELDTT